MNWKQPLDTGIYDDFGEDHLARDLWMHLVMKARNEDMVEQALYKGKPYKLKRGDVLFGRNAFAVIMRTSPSGCANALKRLQKVYSRVTSIASKNYTVVTILNYDEVVSLKQADKQASNKQVTSRKQASNKQSDTTIECIKSDKSDKSVREEKISPAQKNEFFFNSVSNRDEVYKEFVQGLVTEKGLEQQYVIDQLDAFTSYWTEPTLSGNKQLWQTKKTFDVARRFANWLRNDKTFNPEPKRWEA